MSSQQVTTAGDGKLHFLRELIGNSVAEPSGRSLYKLTITNPSFTLNGVANAGGTVTVGFDSEITVAIGVGTAITVKTDNPANVVWNDNGVVCNFSVFWYVDEVEVRPVG